VRIISLNAWGGAMFDELRRWVPDCGADVLALQEVSRTHALDGWTSFQDAERRLPQRANLWSDVARLLPGHQSSFVASDTGPVADEHGNLHRQDFGLAMFVGGEWPVVGQVAGHVHGSYVEHDQWPHDDRPRVAQGMRVADSARGRMVSVVHLHGLRDSQGKHDTPARRQQAANLVQMVEQLRAAGDLTVVCGDLNLLPDSETFRTLAELDLVDLVETADTRTSRYAKPIRHANYLLVSDVDAVVNFEILKSPEVSDHRALVLDI
jgi:endonuclease/exonuclease/phosphatase family metal-dependent hydrolase